MAKKSTSPTLYDEVKQISITKLKQWGYLEPGQIRGGVLNWNVNGTPTGSIAFQVDMLNKTPYIQLEYNFKDEPRNYKINLVCMPSNLGRGKIWYFLCPRTEKRCRKLYNIGGYFLHREAFAGCMYQSQTESKFTRYLGNTLGLTFEADEAFEKIHSKHFRKYYNGKRTKRYSKLLKVIEKAGVIDVADLYERYP